jgi:hypothetical protein
LVDAGIISVDYKNRSFDRFLKFFLV